MLFFFWSLPVSTQILNTGTEIDNSSGGVLGVFSSQFPQNNRSFNPFANAATSYKGKLKVVIGVFAKSDLSFA